MALASRTKIDRGRGHDGPKTAGPVTTNLARAWSFIVRSSCPGPPPLFKLRGYQLQGNTRG